MTKLTYAKLHRMMEWSKKCDQHFGTIDPSGLGAIAKKYDRVTDDPTEFFNALTDAFEQGIKVTNIGGE